MSRVQLALGLIAVVTVGMSAFFFPRVMVEVYAGRYAWAAVFAVLSAWYAANLRAIERHWGAAR